MKSIETAGQVITFYSYKGGTGRSMALANVACLLAQRQVEGRGVLMVDWDLEAPGLHRFFRGRFTHRFGNSVEYALDQYPGLIDLFWELDAATRSSDQGSEGQTEEAANKLLSDTDLDRFILETDIPSLYLLKAGRFDRQYSTRVNTFQWEAFYNRSPWLIRLFAERLAEQYQYVLIDSRTGLTDISGICTMLLPERLVVIFTPNRQSLTGLEDLIRRATNYRRQSDDLRPLVVFPLVSRIEPTESILRQYWRFGNPEQEIIGYQPQFEKIFQDVYDLPECKLDAYFNEMLIQHVPSYAYGEEIAVLAKESGDSLALARRYESFTEWLVKLAAPWELATVQTATAALRSVGPGLRLSEVCPYRGLAAFTEADAEFFFGRQQVVNRLLQSLRRELRFLAVLGPSGSGKSSLVQAGLLPQLRQGVMPGSDRWGVIITRPADHPFAQLAAQELAGASEDLAGAVQEWLARHLDQTRLVLVIDQFEELLAICPDPLRQAFMTQLTRLLTTSLPISVVLVMRDDFYGRFVYQAPTLLAWLERGLINLPPTLERDELTAIIQEPARTVGLVFEAGLVETIVDDTIETAPASKEKEQIGRSTILPLLEFILAQLWERRQEGWLTHKAYHAIGGLTGGLTQSAERALSTLEEKLLPLARRILTGLVQVGDESQELPDIRRRRLLADLCPNEREREAVNQVVRRLTDARLLVMAYDKQHDQETVEIIHDALIRNWMQLRSWLDEDRQFLRWRQRLRATLAEWERTGHDEGVLLRGVPLTEAERFLEGRPDDLNQAEREFIQVSREWQVQEEQRRRELYEEAERQRQIALARQLAAQAEMVRSTSGDSLLRSVLLAVESLRHYPTLEGDQVLRHGLALLPRPVARMTHFVPNGVVNAVAFSPDGTYLATASQDKTARVWEATSGREVVRLTHRNPVWAVAFSPDGKYLATASQDNTTQVWEATSGREVKHMTHRSPVWAIAFSPDGEYLATAGGVTARVWEVTSEREVARMTHEKAVNAVAFSPDGRYLATAGGVTARVSEATSRREVTRMTHEKAVNAVAFSPDGRYLATASPDKTARVWKVTAGREVTRMTHARMTHDSDVVAVAFSPDGKYLATAGGVTARVWEVTSEREVTHMTHDSDVVAVAFSPDGKYLATAGGVTARVWEVTSEREVTRMTHEKAVNAVAFSPDGRYLATASPDKTARVWKVTASREVTRMTHDSDVVAVAFSPDGRYLATASPDKTARVWETDTGREIVHIAHEGMVNAVTFSPDGKHLATTSYHIAQVWEATSSREVAHLIHEDFVRAVVFSPDGKHLATASEDKTARVWETTSGREVSRLTHDSDVVAVAFSPDGRYLATASWDKTARVWEATSGREVAHLIHEDLVRAVVFSPDGRYLATASEDRTARLWLWRPEDLIAEACSRLTRNLTPEEWRQYLGDEPYRKTCPNLP